MNAFSVLSTIHSQSQERLRKRIRITVMLFMVSLALSGITAFPVQSELHLLLRFGNLFPEFARWWLMTISAAIDEVAVAHPYLLYGYDWLAFAHLVIAMFFWGVYKNPVQNRWVVRIGMIACIGIFPLAFICGSIRGIPFFWTLIDCSFGFFGIIPLLLIDKWIGQLKENILES
jgi:hypothetical protein